MNGFAALSLQEGWLKGLATVHLIPAPAREVALVEYALSQCSEDDDLSQPLLGEVAGRAVVRFCLRDLPDLVLHWEQLVG